ncbi:MAG: glycoside hydrolase family 2 protein, partial [Lentisphaerae bacterium]|nr:glycoside hydrolase family 2 protein [Lentisphaerota bacterium]
MKQFRTLLNDNWLFTKLDNNRSTPDNLSKRGFTPITLPHANEEVPLNYFSEKRTQFISWYKRELLTPDLPEGGRVFIDFDGVMMAAEVFVNGQQAHTHRGGFVGFSVDATPFLKSKPGSKNSLTVRVDSRLLPDIPPCGKVMDFQVFGGIYRDVWLRVTPGIYFTDLFVTTPAPLDRLKTVATTATVHNSIDADFTGSMRLDLLSSDGLLIASSELVAINLSANSVAEIETSISKLKGIKLWDVDHPNMYKARISLLAGRKVIDRYESKFGFREVVFTKEGPFLLNGKPLKLLGLNRHQIFPYIGAAAPVRLQRRDADIVKYELGSNIVRTSHYPQSPHFLDRCDEIGLLVFEEAPGWGHIGEKSWQDLFCRDVEYMIKRDRNHPSIILWGVRVNESPDHSELYSRTNTLARKLDPSRQ